MRETLIGLPFVLVIAAIAILFPELGITLSKIILGALGVLALSYVLGSLITVVRGEIILMRVGK